MDLLNEKETQTQKTAPEMTILPMADDKKYGNTELPRANPKLTSSSLITIRLLKHSIPEETDLKRDTGTLKEHNFIASVVHEALID